MIDIRQGDCALVLKEFPENHFDSCVTDPPYGIGFMGKKWDLQDIRHAAERRLQRGPTVDRVATGRTSVGFGAASSVVETYDFSIDGMRAFTDWTIEWASEVIRVLKPGAHALIFGSPRTGHRLTVGLEDAGFEIRDTLMWIYGSGFPKSLDVSKAIDKALGAERQIIGRKTGRAANPKSMDLRGGRYGSEHGDVDVSAITGPATEEAAQWSGWGTALKPAYEPIVLVRKPPEGTIASNVLRWGVGGLNIQESRVPFASTADREKAHDNALGPVERFRTSKKIYEGGRDSAGFADTHSPAGRWPGNVILDEESADMLDVQTGVLQSGEGTFRRNSGMGYKGSGTDDELHETYGDRGGASRFFYCAKSSRDEREFGLESFPIKERATPMAGRGQPGLKCRKCGRWKVSGNPCVCPEPDFVASQFSRPANRNTHPTVKPIALMRYLVRLITPIGGTVLDPFAGSGTTLIAAGQEGRDAIGIEKEQEYVDIAQARTRAWLPLETAARPNSP